jgi:hypothetical protein
MSRRFLLGKAFSFHVFKKTTSIETFIPLELEDKKKKKEKTKHVWQ